MEQKKQPLLPKKEFYEKQVMPEIKKKFGFWIFKKGQRLAKEHKEEILQNLYLELLEKSLSGHLRQEDTWQAIVNQRCRGAILDYKKGRKGFIDHGGLRKVSNVDSEGNTVHLEETLNKFKIICDNPAYVDSGQIKIKFDLLSHLAATDKTLKVFVQNKLLGFTLDQLVPHYNLETTRLNQMVQEFEERFKKSHEAKQNDPDLELNLSFLDQCGYLEKSIENDWFNQVAFALGISELLEKKSAVVINANKIALGMSFRHIDFYNIDPCPSYLVMQNQPRLDI